MTAEVDPVTESAMSYVYAVSRAGTPLDEALAGRPGLEGGPLRAVRAGELMALVSSVPSALYGTEGMKAQMEDLGRLEVLARTHHAVVEAAYEHAAVLPMRLATVYLDDERVRGMLGEREPEFTALLDRLNDHVELGVKVYADPREAVTVSSGGPETDTAASPGRAYLQRRRAQQQNHRRTYRAAGAVASEVTARVAGIAAAHVTHRPQQGDLAQAAGENIVNDAYLVHGSQADAFRAALAGLADDTPGVRVEITGPWAPYSFATPPAPGGGGTR
ncbi:MAG TPA: GvpL/GvpF family gas vesicle protein [Streptomyces sp.]|uniref:GvpL/GvpF family gas vesicle protein n=1 Tax=Streptomyces sp. TaxID=1931 RepID=UPI002B9305E0|nr:GvpL/GvpF family gas vesicle protein [Streptomyces sp.]HWU11599.1 GvpL/GvpF family gas vesicle protein [Streptomyces sp.]